MSTDPSVSFLKWALPHLGKRWAGFRHVHGQVTSRIVDRLQELGLRSFAAYRTYLREHPDEWDWLDARCRVTVSCFYRDPPVFDCLRETVLPELAREHGGGGASPLHVWSVGAASGEEPYTLRIVWRHAIRDAVGRLPLHVSASEAESHMLNRARRACYQRETLANLPDDWIDRAFEYEPGRDEGAHAEPYCLRPIYRRHVTWRHEDIRSSMPDGPFSLICCRNLAFTYFDPSLQRDCLEHLIARLRPGGVLVLGQGESLPDDISALPKVRGDLPVYRYRVR